MHPYSSYLNSTSNPPPLVYLKEGEIPPPMHDVDRRVYNLALSIPETTYLTFTAGGIKDSLDNKKASVFFLGTSPKMQSDFEKWISKKCPFVLDKYPIGQFNLHEMIPTIADKLKEHLSIKLNSLPEFDEQRQHEEFQQTMAMQIQQSLNNKGYGGRTITLRQAVLLLEFSNAMSEAFRPNPPPGVHIYRKGAPLPPAYDPEKKISYFPFTYPEISYLSFLEKVLRKGVLKKDVIFLKTTDRIQSKFTSWLIKTKSAEHDAIVSSEYDLKKIVSELVDKAKEHVGILSEYDEIMSAEELLEIATELTQDLSIKEELDLEEDLPILMAKADELNKILLNREQQVKSEKEAIQANADEIQHRFNSHGIDGRAITHRQAKYVYKMFNIYKKESLSK